MKHSKKLVSLTALSLLVSFSSWGQQYVFTYSKLYSQLKHNVSKANPDVKVAFFFTNKGTGKLCTPVKAWMENQKHSEQLKIGVNKELIVPLDSNLKEANPLVFVDTPTGKQCDFSTTIMTREQLSGTVTYSQLQNIVEQMQSVLNELGGMFSSWFTPKIEGVTLEFSDKLPAEIEFSNGLVKPITDGKVHILLSDIGTGRSIIIPEQTSRILPYIPK
ncbi:DUF2987 domain-containing protein [Vibrio marisflavi]|uniref:DUF2987 domain-containing protein n=1 Tax=Vibrio marisflavi CECT 7928 TaxID=634439 RepID=A0ABM9A4N3_9VIBR|nr:DUF2987 domain-containing protein [Vibrio marisflavi]CAH0539871.1 hypothetical protein VMF7928_02500 [Vibrio marisflavi CECT 7928]